MTEQRRAPRQDTDLEIIEINGQPGAGSRLLDISEYGAKIATSMVFVPGDPVEFGFIFPGEEGETHHNGQVVWVMPAPSMQGHQLLGLEFLIAIDLIS